MYLPCKGLPHLNQRSDDTSTMIVALLVWPYWDVGSAAGASSLLFMYWAGVGAAWCAWSNSCDIARVGTPT